MTRDRWWAFQQRFPPYFFVSPFLLLFSAFLLYPLGRSFVMSLYRWAGPRTHVFVGIGNYRFLLLHDLIFWYAVGNTTLYTIAFLAVQIPASLGLALLLNSNAVRCRNLFRFSFFSSYLVGQVFVAVVFSQLLGRHGLANMALSRAFGRDVMIGWLTNPDLVMPSVLLASLWLSIGFGMIYFLAALQAVDRELYEAAAIDGAGAWGSFWNVTLPGIKPVLVYVLLVGTIGAFQLFELPYVLFQGPGPNGRAMTIVMYLFTMGFDSGDLGYAAAVGWILVFILLMVSLAQLKLTRAAET